MSIKKLIRLRELFINPDAEYRPVPFWFWNSRIDPDEIERQVRLMHEAGLGGFFMHARFGLETEYMGEEWMLCVKRAVNAAYELGIYAWLYDEYPFPSGVGGLKVTHNPDYCNKFIDLAEAAVNGPKDIDLQLPEGNPILACLTRTDPIDHFEILTPANSRAKWHIPEGEWRITVFIERTLQDPRGNVFGPNYLNSDMTQAFLDVLDGYTVSPEIKDHLGKTIPGIFTDEPCILSWHQNHTNYPSRRDGRIVAWSSNMPEHLGSMGYDWRQVVPSLFYDTGENSSELRFAYRKAVADEYIENFFVPYKRWCDRNNLKLTGHLLLEEGLYTNTIFQGDFVRDLSYFDIPGTDHLGIGCEAKYGGWGNLPLMSTNIQGQKLVSSIAHIYGKEAVLSESFGVSGWGLSMADMKRIVDWQYRLGINFLCPHAFYYSMEGFRKHDSPPSQFFQATYWKYYRYFSDYVARLSLLMRAGRHVAQAAIFYPHDNFWSAFKAGQEGEIDRCLEDNFDFYASNLLKCHVDYDIVTEDLIKKISGITWTGEEQYELIVIPAIRSISESMLEIISQFYAEGGKLLITSPVCRAISEKLNSEASSKGNCVILDSMETDVLKDALDRLLISDVAISSHEVTFIHRQIENKHIYFFASDSSHSLDVQIRMRATGSIERWDLETGETHIIPSKVADGYTRINWDFPPYGSLAIVIDPDISSDDSSNLLRTQHSGSGNRYQLGDTWEFSCESLNALILDDWKVKITTKGDWIYYDYTTNVLFIDLPDSILLMLDDIESRSSFMAGMQFKIFVNGHEIPQSPSGFYIDSKWRTLEIGEYIKQKTEIKIQFINQSWAGEPKGMTIPPKILGSFALSANDDKYTISKPPNSIQSCRSWTDQGYPFYSGTAKYTQKLELNNELLAAKEIWLETTEVADMIEFIINGECASVRPWQPYKCEIRQFLQKQNTISLKVTNSMRNFLEKDAKPSGLLGVVSLRIIQS